MYDQFQRSGQPVKIFADQVLQLMNCATSIFFSRNTYSKVFKMASIIEDQQMVNKLKLQLKEHLVNNESMSSPVREAIVKYSLDEELLLKFIKGRKQNLDKALGSLVNYADLRVNKYPELFRDDVPDFVTYAFQSGILSVLKNKDSLGRTIVWFKVSKWDVSRISLEEIICAGRYLVDILMKDSDFLTKGAIAVTDCDGATLSHAAQFTVSNVTKFVNIFWQAYPIQIKGLYHVNAPFFVRPVYSLVKPFLPAKLRERVLIASGVKELHKRLQSDILPESVDGVLPDEEALSIPFPQSEIKPREDSITS